VKGMTARTTRFQQTFYPITLLIKPKGRKLKRTRNAELAQKRFSPTWVNDLRYGMGAVPNLGSWSKGPGLPSFVFPLNNQNRNPLINLCTTGRVSIANQYAQSQ